MTKRNSLKLGFVGLGLMGTPMTLRLLNAAFEVCVWNRSIEKYDTVVTAGAKIAVSIKQLTASCDVIMLCLSDTTAVEQVVFGEGGLATSGTSDKVLVDFSSIDPERIVVLAI